jgi:uncharacterized protein involved in exopolysaccharide biosynthesis
MRLTFPAERGETVVLVAPVAHAEERRSLRDCWCSITTRFWLIAAFFCGTVLTTALLLGLMPPTYTAEVTLLIEPTPARGLARPEASAELFAPEAYGFYQTQYALLHSRALAAQVIRTLRLHPHHLKGAGSSPLKHPQGSP